MTVDIADVAARAGVSTATVSRALRGLPNVAEATRERVLQAARELDYVISPSASRLASGRTRTVGVVSPWIGRWFFGQVLGGMEEVLRSRDYDMLLYALPDPESRSRFFAQLPLRRRVDAVLVLTLPLDEAQVQAFRGLEVPVAFVGAKVPGCFWVRIDDVSAARTATNHLLNLGHRRIGLIGGHGDEPTHFTAPDARLEGYAEALHALGVEPDPALVVDGAFTVAGGEHAMSTLLSIPVPPTAVFALSDEMAFGAIRAIRAAGLSVPRDISVIGFDDHEMAAVVDLTTMAQPVAEQGRLAAARILAALDDPSGTQEASGQFVPTRLVIRGTTAPPAAPA